MACKRIAWLPPVQRVVETDGWKVVAVGLIPVARFVIVGSVPPGSLGFT